MLKTKFKIVGLGVSDKAYAELPVGRQSDFAMKIAEFKRNAKKAYVSQKRKSNAAAWREFKEAYQPDQYFAQYFDGPAVRDDVFEVFYTSPA